MAAARAHRFDEGHLVHAAYTVASLVAGVLLIALGRAIRAVDDQLADFD